MRITRFALRTITATTSDMVIHKATHALQSLYVWDSPWLLGEGCKHNRPCQRDVKSPYIFFFFFLILFIYLFIYFWLCWVFVSVRGLSLVVASGGHSSSRCAGLSLSRPLLLPSTGSRRAGSVIVAHGPSCCAACGILPDQGSNPCPLRWQADSQPLCHQGSPPYIFLTPVTSGHACVWSRQDLLNFVILPILFIISFSF